MQSLDASLSLLLPGLILLHLMVAPYTKVEESFNMQAAHDVLVYGMPTADVSRKLTASYDHFSFPGAVPRTFLGPVILAGVSQPLVATLGFRHAQLIVRAVLGLFNAFALLVFKSNLARAYGRPTARWWAVLQASQFHVMFYASRTLPNMFAFGLTTLAYSCLLPTANAKSAMPRQRLAIALFVLAAVVFRSEVALLLATNAAYLLIVPLTSLHRLLAPFLVSFVIALLVSVPLDSYFWQKPLWPELWGFYYNAVLGSSSNWGVSPWHYYFTSALPRLLLNPVAVALVGVALRQPGTSRAARQLVVPNLLFVAVYSLQPHKETRFIFYVVPPLTAAAALGANFVFSRASRSVASRAASLALILSVPICLAASTAMLLLSSLNYPGGEALEYLRTHAAVDDATTGGVSTGVATGGAVVLVHADVLACMTGVTLFSVTAAGSTLPSHHGSSQSGAQAGAGSAGAIGSAGTVGAKPGQVSLAVDKTEAASELRDPEFWTVFDYVIVENPDKVRGGRWEVVGVVEGLRGVEILRPGQVAPGDDSEGSGAEAAGHDGSKVVGRGRVLRDLKSRVRGLTGGWWVGPRMVPRLRVLKRVKGAQDYSKSTSS